MLQFQFSNANKCIIKTFKCLYENVPVVEFMYLASSSMTGESYRGNSCVCCCVCVTSFER